LCLLGLAVSGMLVSRAQQQRDRRNQRLTAVVSPHSKLARAELSAFIGPPANEHKTPLRSLAALFGFDPEKTALYPVKWWIVLAAALGIALFSRQLTAEFLGGGSILAIPVTWVVLCRNYFGWIENRRRGRLLQQFPDALALIVRAIRVGIPVMEAMRIVSRECGSPTAGEFARLVDQVAIGTSLEDAVADLARRTGLPEYRFFATALSLQNQTGGTLSDTLENLADVIRKRAALKARGKALTSEARASAVILAFLPLATGGILYLINPPYISILFTNPSGQSMLGGAAISLTCGLLTIRAIIRRSLPR
jgi:tight adherence protein B